LSGRAAAQPAFDLSTASGRRRAYVAFVARDHAWIRLAFQNAHRVSDELVRTNQPWPHQLAAWKARGIRTVVNLRGAAEGACHAIESDACDRLGLELVSFRVSSREAPSRDQVRAAGRMFETIAYPAVMHCKSGADRTSVMAVLYLHLRKGVPIREARAQLGLRYLHWPAGRTGVLDYVFARYLEEAEPRGLDFAAWVESPAYDPVRLVEAYRRTPAARSAIGRLLRRA
jgi:protein tyrosine/serine phosphatase